ncbi:MAG: hypothetical protein LAO31_18505 [Acidobacteriia bacterium]|nr:hypothetical protein [Terriglobia bacterium]
MRRVSSLLMAAVLLLSLVSVLGAQSKTLTGDMTVVKGTVEAIDHEKRVLTLKDSKGEFTTVDVPEGAKRFPQIKIGDAISIRYYDNVIVRLKPAGEPDVDSDKAAITPAAGEKPAGTIAKQRVITATIQEIDRSIPSITFVGPNGWKYSRRVTDKKALEKVKVGDRVDITWTTAVLFDVEGGKK